MTLDLRSGAAVRESAESAHAAAQRLHAAGVAMQQHVAQRRVHATSGAAHLVHRSSQLFVARLAAVSRMKLFDPLPVRPFQLAVWTLRAAPTRFLRSLRPGTVLSAPPLPADSTDRGEKPVEHRAARLRGLHPGRVRGDAPARARRRCTRHCTSAGTPGAAVQDSPRRTGTAAGQADLRRRGLSYFVAVRG